MSTYHKFHCHECKESGSLFDVFKAAPLNINDPNLKIYIKDINEFLEFINKHKDHGPTLYREGSAGYENCIIFGYCGGENCELNKNIKTE